MTFKVRMGLVGVLVLRGLRPFSLAVTLPLLKKYGDRLDGTLLGDINDIRNREDYDALIEDYEWQLHRRLRARGVQRVHRARLQDRVTPVPSAVRKTTDCVE